LREKGLTMLQTIILIMIVGAATAYAVYSVRNSLTRPDCGCGHESECPYAGKCTGRHDCPFPPEDESAANLPRH
jgi:hypothetical protein